MLKNKIYNYIFNEVIKTFFIVLFAFTVIAWAARAVNFLDLIVDNGVSFKTYMLYTGFQLSNILTKFVPVSFLLALTLSIIKLKKNNELLILWLTGIKKYKIINFFFFLSVLILIFQFTLGTIITPYLLQKSRILISSTPVQILSTVIKSNTFSDSFEGTTIYTEKKTSRNELEKITIIDYSKNFQSLSSNPEKTSEVIIVANTGLIDKTKLYLKNGIIQTKTSDNKLENISFETLELPLDSLSTRTIKKLKLQEISTKTLFNCLNNSDLNEEIACPRNNISKNVTETLSRRMGMPLYIPFVSLIMSFLLISNLRKTKFVIYK
ncbi:LptF/LptG family permease, partial [Pelagibacteraceae bacterium]|nr:LptF/LptG family permease [Pelagibacteraceae bacterium]